MYLGVFGSALKLLWESLKIEFQVDFDLWLPRVLWVFDIFTVFWDTQAALGSFKANPPFPDVTYFVLFLWFLDLLESYQLQNLELFYSLLIWPVLVVQFSFEFLINDAAWEEEV